MTAGVVVAGSEAGVVPERLDITGSHLARADMAGMLAVTVIDREAIEFSGKTSVADLLRDIPFNSAGSPRPQSGSPAQSFAGLNLRGLGVGRTLILIDGRRLPVAPNVGEGQDLNAIPLAAVERIEILPEGASAIYGSDAMGGVVNIITRKHFTGVEFTAGISVPKHPGGDTEEGSILFGAADDRGRVFAGVSYNVRDIFFQRDREWSRGGASIFSNNFLTRGFSFLNHPDFGSANVAGCQGEGFTTDLDVGRCFYDFTLVAADEAATRNSSLFTRASYDITDDWTIYANIQVNRVETFGRYAPVPSSPWLVGGFGAIVLSPGLPNHPATPPGLGGLNPLWEDYQDFADDTLLLTHRFAANGPRDTSTDATTYDLGIGMRGRVDRFHIDFGVRRTDSQYFELGRNFVVSALAQPQLDNGNYNIYDPLGNSEDVLQSFTATINRDARTLQQEAYALASTDLPFDLGAGPIGVAFGAEYREEEYKDIFDDLQDNGNITGSAGTSASTGRSSWAAFGEILVPLLDTLELTGALRYADHRSSGRKMASRVALSWQLSNRLVMRASGGKQFRAPPLAVLGRATGRSAVDVWDPRPVVFPVPRAPSFIVANEKVGFEEAVQYRLGFDFEPFVWLNASLDLWEIDIDDRIVLIPGQLVANCVFGTVNQCPSGLRELPPVDQFPDPSLGLGVARDPFTGNLLFVQTGYGNFGNIETRGADLRLQGRTSVRRGLLAADVLATYVDRYRIDECEDMAGGAGMPKWRGRLQIRYLIDDLAFAWNIQHIDGQESGLHPVVGSLPSWTTHDIQANWYTPWNGRITLGVDNLTDKDPVLDPGEPRGFNFELYNGYGRIWYLRYRQNW